MDIKVVSKYLRISPEKARHISALLPGKSVKDAEAMLTLSPRKAARLFLKLLKSAVANAENEYELDKDDLHVKAAFVGPGPIIKRYRPKARGMAGRIRKRTSHFTLILSDK